MLMVYSTCKSVSLANILSIVKRLLSLIQIIVPILLIIWAVITLIQMINNPNDNGNHKKIIMQFFSAMIVFFIPVVVNLFIGILGEKSNFSSCWIHANDKLEQSTNYITLDENSKKIFLPNGDDYEPGVQGNLYGEALSARALSLACSAIGTNYLTAADAAKVGCTLNGDGRLKVPKVAHSHKYRAELPQTANIIKFWDEEKALGKWGIGTYGPASCSPWIGSLLRSMGYDNNIATAEAAREGLRSPWTGEIITNSISAHGIGTYMYYHSESFDTIKVDSSKSIAEQCQPGDILAHSYHILIFVGNELAQKFFPGTTGDSVEAAENGRCYPGVTAAGRGKIGSYKVFRVKKEAVNYIN